MIKKFSKLFLVLGVLLFSLVLTSCYKEERFTFKEGKYEYSGESFNFYNEINIKYISLDFSKDNIENKDTSILINRKNNESYYVDFLFENERGEDVYCTFEYHGKVGDQIDRYHIKLDVSNLIKCENSFIIMVLEINNSNYYSEDKCDSKADQIFLFIKNFTIDGNVVTEYSFPSRLLLKYVEEE